MSISVPMAMAAALVAGSPPAHVMEGQAQVVVRADPLTLLELAKRMDASWRHSARRPARADARPPLSDARDFRSMERAVHTK